MAKTAEQYKKLSIKEFTKAAQKYESDNAGVYKMCRKDYPPILEELEKEDFETLLDAGCGTAPMLTLLCEKYPDKKFTGLDLTPAMIEKAKEKNLPNAEFLVGDCENMPFEPESFDVIINSQSYHHYPNPQNFFYSVARCLKPGGRLILRDNTGTPWMLWIMNKIEMPFANLTGKGDYQISSMDEIRTYCKNAGLTVETIERRNFYRMHLVVRKPE